MSDNAADRAEDIWLSAESLERHLTHAEASEDVLSAVADVVIAARELYSMLNDSPVGEVSGG